jgi:hypothetical protein
VRKRGICRNAEHLNPSLTQRIQYALACLSGSILIVVCCISLNIPQGLTFGEGLGSSTQLTNLETLRDQVSLELQRASAMALFRKRQR